MKKVFFYLIALAILAAACGPKPTAAPTTAPTQPEPTQPAPATGPTAYPIPNLPTGLPPSGPNPGYPPPGTAETADWATAQTFLISGQVVQVTQSHSLQVILTLRDGRQLATTEPAFDDVLKVIEQCGDLCKDIVVTTE
jgi:hypothetical protein